MRCSNCGAPLKVEAHQTTVACGYCEATTVVSTPREQRSPGARPSGAPAARTLMIVALTGLVVLGVAVAVVARSGPPKAVTPTPATSSAHVQRSMPEPANEAIASAEVASAPSEQVVAAIDAGPERVEAVAEPAKKKARPAPAYTGPVLTKREAEQALEPEIRSCMKQHGVHYLITRLGNERRGGSVPALRLTGTSVVDYQPTPSFAKTPLGRCVAKAGSAVHAPAYRGNYIYFGLRNDSVPDPLADAPASLDRAEAERALAALDDEAHDCAARDPAGSRPGESVRVSVSFYGATGKVASVSPIYVDAKSAYGRCLSSVYRKAMIAKFRKIEDKVMHSLAR